MEIVSHSQILRRFRNIDIFKVDLGFNLKGKVNMQPGKGDDGKKLKVRDEFIIKYKNLNGNYINKYGDIGNLKFYEDTKLRDNIILIFGDKQIFEVEFTKEDESADIRKYLSDLLEQLDKAQNTKPDEIDMVKENGFVVENKKTYTNMSEDIKVPDISMPKDQYLEAMVKKRRQSWNNLDIKD